MASKVSFPVNLPATFIQQTVFAITAALRNLFQSLSSELSDHARRINAALVPDGTEGFRAYTVAEVATLAPQAGAMIYVSNESGGKTMAFSDGTNWRRVQDRAVVS